MNKKYYLQNAIGVVKYFHIVLEQEENEKLIKGFYKRKYSASAAVVFASFHGVKRLAGAVQHDRHDNRRPLRRNGGTFRGVAKQPDT